MKNPERYSRQVLVDAINSTGQLKLSKAKVAIIGVGGLGCQVASQLAGAGVGNIQIIDSDVVSLSNLHRQVLYREHHVGKPKAIIALKELRLLNSEIVIKANDIQLSIGNVNELLEGITLVIDAADNFPTSYILSDFCAGNSVTLLSASVNRTFGFVGVFCGDESLQMPSYRDVFPKLPKNNQNCDIVGVTGPSVGIIASFQAQEALKIIIGDKSQLLGTLLYLDLWNYSQHTVDFSNAVQVKKTVNLIDRDQLDINDVIIDVRNADEISCNPHPINIHKHISLIEILNWSETVKKQLPKDSAIVFVCQTGQRAMIACQQLMDKGYPSVRTLLI